MQSFLTFRDVGWLIGWLVGWLVDSFGWEEYIELDRTKVEIVHADT